MTDFSTNLKRGVLWINNSIDHFSLRHASDEEERLQLLKPLGELALAAQIMSRCDLEDIDTTEVIHWCWDELDRGEILLHTLAVRPDLIVTSTLYSCFANIGLKNLRLEKLIAYLRDSPSARSIELPTWRRLDVEHGFEALGLTNFPENPENSTWFGSYPEPWTITDDIAYALTHNIFYITDFGFSQSRLSSSAKNYLRSWLPVWLEIYRSRSNWDIFAELLMVCACVGESEGFTKDMSDLAKQQSVEGMVLGPKNSAKNIIKQDHSFGRITFLQNYHTTLVSLMAFALFSSKNIINSNESHSWFS